jgi:hypothetical protein
VSIVEGLTTTGSVEGEVEFSTGAGSVVSTGVVVSGTVELSTGADKSTTSGVEGIVVLSLATGSLLVTVGSVSVVSPCSPKASGTVGLVEVLSVDCESVVVPSVGVVSSSVVGVDVVSVVAGSDEVVEFEESGTVTEASVESVGVSGVVASVFELYYD